MVFVCGVVVSHLGSVTARHCSSECQPNFAALNRGRHLYLAGRPSRWALAHISSTKKLCFCLYYFCVFIFAENDFNEMDTGDSAEQVLNTCLMNILFFAT